MTRAGDARPATRRPLAMALLAGSLLLAGCHSGEPGAVDEPPDGADDPALDAALSTPRRDSVYPGVGTDGIDALHYGLDLDWDTDTERLEATATIALRATRDDRRFRLDLGSPLEVSEVLVDGEPAPYRHRDARLWIRTPVRQDQRYTVSIDYAGRPEPVDAPTTRSDLPTLGFTVTERGEVWTMQEPFGAYTWYPVNDHPSDKALYDVTISVPEPWVGVSGGRLRSRSTEDGRTTTSFHLDRPAASYLTTLAIGDYRHETDRTEDGLPLSYWVPRRLADRVLPRVRRTRAAVEWVADKLGPWPFSSAGTLVVDSVSGMETQTLITLGATDYALSDEVLVHEMVHQFWGDQVTPDDWRDLWMNEGMALYLQGVYRAETTGRPVQQVMDQWAADEQYLRDEAGPPGDYDPTTFGSGNVYYGPALMWHELRRTVGDEAFWSAVRGWPGRHSYGNADREDLVSYLERSTGAEVADLVEDWLMSPTTPARRG